jgi:hypothetical protein
MHNEVRSKGIMWVGLPPISSSSTEPFVESTGEGAVYNEEPPKHVESLPKDAEHGPASVILDLTSGEMTRMQIFIRTWKPEKGFYYKELLPRLEAPQPVWSDERWKQENALIAATGLDPFSVILPLVCDVKNEQNPVNYVSLHNVESLITRSKVNQRVPLQIGPNEKNLLWLQLDTGSHLSWVQSRMKRSTKLPEDRQILDLTIEGTAKFKDGTGPHEIPYGLSRSKVQINLYEGQFALGRLQAQFQTFGAVSFEKAVSLPTGLLGMGFAKPGTPVPYHPNLVQNFAKDGKLKHASFTMIGPRSEPANSKPINERKEKNRGWFVLGTLDPKYHRGITWCDFVENQKHLWAVRLNSVSVNGVVICKDQIAIIDSGTSYLVTRKENLDSATPLMKGIRSTEGIIYPPGSLIDMSFTFGPPALERSFKLNREDLSLGPSEDATNPKWLRSPLVNPAGFDELFGQNYWVLGGIFIDNMITIFDYTDKKKIGFAEKSDVDPVI